MIIYRKYSNHADFNYLNKNNKKIKEYEYVYINQQKIGIFRKYDLLTNRLNQIIYYVKDIEHGKYIKIFRNGDIQLIYNNINGKKEGIFTEWWSKDIIRNITYYKDNQKNGKYMYYFPDGELWQDMIYKNDKIISVNFNDDPNLVIDID